MLRNPVEADKGRISNCVQNRVKNWWHAAVKIDGRGVKRRGRDSLKGGWMCWQEYRNAIGLFFGLVVRTDLPVVGINDINRWTVSKALLSQNGLADVQVKTRRRVMCLDFRFVDPRVPPFPVGSLRNLGIKRDDDVATLIPLSHTTTTVSSSLSPDTADVLPTPSASFYRRPQHRRCKVRDVGFPAKPPGAHLLDFSEKVG